MVSVVGSEEVSKDVTSIHALDSTSYPLAGIKVLEVASIVSGPYTGKILADFGAEVLKVEDPKGGDSMRNNVPKKDDISLIFARLNVGKKSIAIDLRRKTGQALLRRIAERVDVMLLNLRASTSEAWGLTYKELTSNNPGLVFAQITGFGSTGRYRNRPGFGTIVDGISGFAYKTGWPDRPPIVATYGLADQLAGLATAYAVAMALYRRNRTGRGANIDLSLYEPMMNVMSDAIVRYSALGEVEERVGNAVGGAAPRGVFMTADGEWVVLSGSSPGTAKRMLDLLGVHSTDPRFRDNEARSAHADELNAIIAEWMTERTREEVLKILESAGVPAGPVYSGRDIVEDDFFREQRSLVDMGSPEVGAVVMPGRLFRIDGHGSPDYSGFPQLGQHTDEILRFAGLGDAEIRDLRLEGIIGEQSTGG